MTFGLQCDESTSVAILDHAADGGIDFIDTSDVYPLGGDLTTQGRTEDILGRWLTGKRDRFVIATKCFGRTGPAPFDGGNSRRHIFDAIEASLRRLQTDYIDLYQLHGFDRDTPIDETLGALDDLVRQGKVRYIGCSNFLTYQLVRAIGRSETLRLARFESVQPVTTCSFARSSARCFPSVAKRAWASSLTTRLPEVCSRASTTARLHLPMARVHTRQRWQMYQNRYWHDREFDTVDSSSHSRTRPPVSLVTLSVAWYLQMEQSQLRLFGASRPDQLDSSLEAAQYVLTDELKPASISSPMTPAWVTHYGERPNPHTGPQRHCPCSHLY